MMKIRCKFSLSWIITIMLLIIVAPIVNVQAAEKDKGTLFYTDRAVEDSSNAKEKVSEDGAKEIILKEAAKSKLPEIQAQTEEIIASGSIENDGTGVTWSIDSSGKLIVSGDGNLNDAVPETLLIKERPWHEYSDYITSAQVSLRRINDLSYLFHNCSKITNIDLTYLETSSTTTMEHMFSGCSSLKELDVNGFRTNRVTDMSNMFRGCASLTELDISKFNAQSVTKMGNMFTGCINLKKIHVPYNIPEELSEEALLPPSGEIWHDSSGNKHTYLPKDLPGGILYSRLKQFNYNFTVEGDRIGEGIIDFELISGYEQGEDITLEVYRADGNGNRTTVGVGQLNAANGYKYEDEYGGTLEEWGMEYTYWAELHISWDTTILVTDKIVKKVEKSNVFEISIIDDSITYRTAKVEVKWVDKDAIPLDHITLRTRTVGSPYFAGPIIELKKGEKETGLLELYDLSPGCLYNYELVMEINNRNVAYWDVFSFTTKDSSFEPVSEIKKPTQAEIIQKWKELGIDLEKTDIYEREVNHIDGGVLNEETLQNATDLTNFIRYTVGLPADVAYDKEWSSICNAASELNRLNGKMDHYPDKPEGITEEFYKRGYKGTSSSNLSWGSHNLPDSILDYMNDWGENNMEKAHRAWILGPGFSITGFGSSGIYRSMYTTGGNYRAGNFDNGYYHWPAADTPVEIYTGGAMTLYLSSEYDAVDNKENITMKVVSKMSGKEWSFSGEEGEYSDGIYSRIYPNGGYGCDTYFVFDTGTVFSKGDEVTVTVTGTTINGEAAPINYTMNFFSLKDSYGSSREMEYNFQVNGDRIGEGFVQFDIMSGYEENEEFSLQVYRSDDTGRHQLIDSVTLNSGNNYSLESTYGATIEEWGREYTYWAELKQWNEQQGITETVLITDKIIKKVDKTKVFELAVVEGSITYKTAKIKVNWVDTDAIGSEEITIRPMGISYVPNISLKKGEKEQSQFEFYYLTPGNTYDYQVIVEINNKEIFYWETFSFTTKELSFEPISEIKKPTQTEIVRKWEELGIDLEKPDIYEREVNHIDGGVLNEETLQNATDLTNFIRYTVGLPADVAYDKEWSSICNAASELNRLNGKMDHYPDKPEGITEEFYKRGYEGTSSSNLSWGSHNLPDSILFYMNDWGEHNMAKGHRAWILGPGFSITGFGSSGAYRSMYTNGGYTNGGNYRAGNFDNGYYHWPAADTPVEIYTGGAMTLYLSSEYDAVDNKENITMKVVSKMSGKEWSFSGEEGEYSDGIYSRIYPNGGYGCDTYFVFDTGTVFSKGDEVTVTVTGTTINGEAAPITYTMNFFSIKDIDVPDIAVESIAISSNTTEVMENRSIQLEATIMPKNATNKNVIWSVESADGKGQAEITKDGLLTGKVEGVVKVTATCESNSSITASIELHVTPYKVLLEAIFLSKNFIRLEKGDVGYIPVTLKPADTTENEIHFESSEPEKVAVANGYVYALEITEKPVTISVTAGDLTAICQVEVYEAADDLIDKNYDTRLTNIRLTGEDNVLIGQTQLIKWYPVTNGQELTLSEYEIDVKCNGKYLSIEPVSSDDNGSCYLLTGLKKGKQTITIKMTSRVEGNIKPETVKKTFTFTVKQEADAAEDVVAAPVLVTNNITINQNTVSGAALDIRFIEGNSEVSQVYLTSMKDDNAHNLFSVMEEDGRFYIQTKEIGDNKKYKLVLHVDTYQGTWEYPITVTTKKTFPKVTVKQLQKPNIQISSEEALFDIIGKEEIERICFLPDSTDFYEKFVEIEGKEAGLTVGQGEHGATLNKKGTLEILFKGYREAYTKRITVGTVSKKIEKHTLVTDIKKVTLNSLECGDIPTSVNMRLINSKEEYPTAVLIEGTNSKTKKMLQSNNLYFTYNKKTGVLNVFAKEGTAQGTYKFALTGYALEEEKAVPSVGKVTLSVVVSTKKPSVSLKASGRIDLITRGESYVTFTPKFKNLSGKIAAVELEGDEAKNFYARVDTDGRVKIYVREKAMVYPHTSYKFYIKATLTNGYECNPISVKIIPKQSPFKATLMQRTITLCKNEIKGQPLTINVKSPVNAHIAYIKPVTVTEGIIFDSDTQTIKITDSEKIKSGKNYKLVFEVTPKGAYRSIKPAKIIVRIKVK